jgi:hypothetical protein
MANLMLTMLKALVKGKLGICELLDVDLVVVPVWMGLMFFGTAELGLCPFRQARICRK